MRKISLYLIGLLGWVSAHAVVVHDIVPKSDDDVIELLPARVQSMATSPDEVAKVARRWISLSREAADPRYLGRAQGVLLPWWDKPDSPAELSILQATIEQSRHEFDKAYATLQGALKRDPSQVQGWLTLATLDRVAARYQQSEDACRQVARHGAAFYAAACILESQSLQGQQDQAQRGFKAIINQAPDSVSQAWLWSLLAESEERAGRDAEAELAYQNSLRIAPDGYTSLAYADLLIRLGRHRVALNVLKNQPQSDAVLLRRAHALRLSQDESWRAVSDELRGRYAAISARGEGLESHARERALQALWLEQDTDGAWRSAQANLKRQKEPIDWYLALYASKLAGEHAAHQGLLKALKQTGLQDARLANWTEGSKR